MKYYFLGRTKDAVDRDCNIYIEKPGFQCNHYFSSIGEVGPCYCRGLQHSYDEIDTPLTEEDYNRLLDYNEKIGKAGYSVKPDSPEYEDGLKLIASLDDIFAKLAADNAVKERIFAEEKVILEDEYNLTEDDVDELFSYIPYDFRDRSVILGTYDSAVEVADQEIEDYGVFDNFRYLEQFFDYEAFGEDLVSDSDRYFELESGTIVEIAL